MPPGFLVASGTQHLLDWIGFAAPTVPTTIASTSRARGWRISTPSTGQPLHGLRQKARLFCLRPAPSALQDRRRAILGDCPVERLADLHRIVGMAALPELGEFSPSL